MVFHTKQIKSQKVAIIDIGSYKIRVAICTIKNGDIELIGYAEKRQDNRHTKSWEIIDLEWVCEDIKIAVQKAQEDADMQVEHIIIGTPFSETYFSAKKINHVRAFPERDIDTKELLEIVSTIQNKAIKTYMRDIEKSVAYKRSDLRLISSQIEKIKIDSRPISDLVWKKWSNVTLFLSNIFIPKHKSEILKYIGNYLDKEIIKIIPTEFALAHLFEQDNNIVIIDIWNAHTSIIVKKNGNILWIQKISIWMNDLIKNIANKHDHTNNYIIENIDSEKFIDMQQEFLAIFMSGVSLTLEEILGTKICPHKLFLLWGWANKFLVDAFSWDNLRSHGIKIANNVEIIKTKWTYFGQMYSKSKASIISMMIASKDIFADKNKPLAKALKQASKDI